MRIVPAFGETLSPEALDAATKALGDGLAIGVPTDTVYGLAAAALVPGATDRLFEMKQRPREVSLPLLVADSEQALSVATSVPEVARRLMSRFWPGALTIVVPSRPEVAACLGDDEATVGVRCPAHVVPRSLCQLAGPLATTSANVHGQPTLTTAAEVADVFGEAVSVVLDAGPCTGAPSTVVDCTGKEPKLLRDGRLPWRALRAALENDGAE